MDDKKQTIFVGVSGGVDSSVAAALLQEAGHNVVGVFIRTWQPEWMTCTWRDERQDAMRVCAHLGIPFLECDLTDVYRDDVAQYMIDEYRAGRTPNPDVMCNKYVKFGAFLDWALAKGADKVATGHYSKLQVSSYKRRHAPNGASVQGGVQYELLRGVDSAKDQSYFLWTLTQEQLQYILLPLGGMEKSKTRKHAERFGLPTASKKDSQGICFLGKISMKEFLSHYIQEEQGSVLDTNGKVIGHHPGSLFFTLGERHGFTITEKHPDDQPLYVVAKDVDANTLTVAPQDRIESGASGKPLIVLESANDMLGGFAAGAACDVQIRYHGHIHRATFVEYDDSKATAKVALEPGDQTVSPGQSFVFYRDEVCLGGGVVREIQKEEAS